jgi:hypothetical protein
MFRSAPYLSLALLFVWNAAGQEPKIVWSRQEAPIDAKIRSLRDLQDKTRAAATKELALEIRALPAVPNKVRLAVNLTNLSTEGDFGRDTLQEVTTTLAQCLREQPQRLVKGKPGPGKEVR